MVIPKKLLPKIERIHTWVSLTLRIILIVALISAAIESRWEIFFLTLITLFLTFSPAIINKNIKVNLPAEFEMTIILFLFASIFLGEIGRFYELFWWWDIFLHGISSLVLGLVGFLIIYVLYFSNKVKTSPILIAVFSFSFAVAIGVVWEVFEFTLDSLLHTTMQKSGLVDTMWDLITNSLGAFIAAIGGFFYVKGRPSFFIKKLIIRFAKENPNLFRN